MLRARAILTHAVLKRPHIVLRRAIGRVSERDYHVAILVFLSVFIFALIVHS